VIPELELELEEVEELEELEELEEGFPELDELEEVLEELELELEELPVSVVPVQAARAILTSPTPINDKGSEEGLNSFIVARPGVLLFLCDEWP
jgi:hypothetical protein